MTTTKDREFDRALDEARPQRVGRPTASLVVDLARYLQKSSATPPITWPSKKWANDPGGFVRDVLGVKLTPNQKAILEAIRDHKRVAVSGGRKVGKDFVCGCAGLWWYSSFEDARVVMTASRAKQVDDVLWRDIRKLIRNHGVCLACKTSFADWRDKPRPCPHSAVIPDIPGGLARTGLKSVDLREITGYTAAEAEGIAGVSGARILYLLDEASAIADDLHTAIRGNLASGDSREVMISNPTRNAGKFFEAFHNSKRFYTTFQLSSEDSPNVISGEELFPGLASRDWILEQREEWGADSALYMIHVLGKFALGEDGKILAAALVTGACDLWETTKGVGVLRIGCDPAGPGGQGDESGFAARRGLKVLEVYGKRGMNEDAHLVEILGLIRKHTETGDDLADVIVDSDGLEGAKVYGTLLAHCHSKPENAQPFRLIRVRGSEKARREPMLYAKVRDEIWGSMLKWLKAGGALPADAKLQRDLNAPAWLGQVTGHVKATPKKDLRVMLGRSPDRGDAVTLACWDPIDYEARAEAQITTRTEVERERRETGGNYGPDPWAGAAQIDPWAQHPRGNR